MSRLDYSKWDHIEISDDEDDTHPNIDTPSLFRWRHQARVERMEQEKKEKEEFTKGYQSHQQKLLEAKRKIKEKEEQAAAEDLAKLKIEVSELEKQEAEWKAKEAELLKKTSAWNIDTICHEGKSKTVINKEVPKKKELSEEEKVVEHEKFIKKHEEEVKKFGMLRRFNDSQEYLSEHPHLACEATANYLVIWCINLEVEDKHDLMSHVAHQTIVMQFILELARNIDTDPRNCIRAFFSRIQMAEKQYMDAFNDELESFKGRVKERAQARIERAMKELEEEERQQRLGPGGLDPAEVFESLPKELQECFEARDTDLLQKVLITLPREEAERHLQRCIDSGLWVADAKAAEAKEKQATQEEEPIYEEPSK